jgi:hypothetical protein
MALARPSGLHDVSAAVLAFVVTTVLAVSPASAVCGDGTVDAGEDCDDGSQNGSVNSCCTAACTFSGKTPDVVVGALTTPTRFGNVGGITAYGIGTTSCNLGSCWLNWIGPTADHPVIGQNMFRLKAGRFEQIGQAWLKHGFAADAGSLCGTCVTPPDGTHLGVNCSDPYSSSLNGSQTRMGPKDDVDPVTGVFPYPDPRTDTTGDAIFKRLQVHDVDLDPALNPTSAYFVEGQYVTRDDAAAGNGTNNASYRAVSIGAAPTFNLTLAAATHIGQAGIQAWKAIDPAVTETSVPAPEGLFILSAKATSLGGGVYHYEYALQNLTNHRAGQSFRVPIPPGTIVTNVGFHDVDYHSGDPYDGTDWTPTVGLTFVRWTTQSYDVNPNANALRWGTLYNFRFDANVAPGTSSIAIGLFRPGVPDSVAVTTVTPVLCGAAPNGTACDDLNGCTRTDTCQSGVCVGSSPVVCAPSDACHDAGTCLATTGACSYPAKPDGTVCDDANACTANDACGGGVCAGTAVPLPGDVGDGVLLSQSGGITTITWFAAPGSTSSAVLRGLVSALPVGPGGGDEVCLANPVGQTSATDAEVPATPDAFWYLIKGENSCGSGRYGFEESNGVPTVPRVSSTCP